jgi:hypothetical protein
LVMGQSKISITKEKKKNLWNSSQLINMSHNSIIQPYKMFVNFSSVFGSHLISVNIPSFYIKKDFTPMPNKWAGA